MASIRSMAGLDQANFSTVEKDFSELTKRIFGNQKILKMLYYNSKDCIKLADITDQNILDEIAEQNIRIIPNLQIPENKGSYIIITFDQFSPNATNPEFVDNLMLIDILCPIDTWMMDSYMMRPFRIMHELNGLLDKSKFNGIGKVNFMGANLLNLGDYTGYQIAYAVINDV